MRQRHGREADLRAWFVAFLRPTGQTAVKYRLSGGEADLLLITGRGAVVGMELKSGRPDWSNELRNPQKWRGGGRLCDYWWLLTAHPSIARLEEIPPLWGWVSVSEDRSCLLLMKRAPKLTPQLPAAEVSVDILRSAKRQAETGGFHNDPRTVRAVSPIQRYDYVRWRGAAYIREGPAGPGCLFLPRALWHARREDGRQTGAHGPTDAPGTAYRGAWEAAIAVLADRRRRVPKAISPRKWLHCGRV